jgi:hypothetical protein
MFNKISRVFVTQNLIKIRQMSLYFNVESFRSSVDIVARLLSVQPKNRGSIPRKGTVLSLLQSIQTVFWAHPSSYSRGTGGKAAGA